MKKKNLNRAVTVALAGLMLVNPVYVMAEKGEGDGVAGGEGFKPGISNEYFEVILPTSATKERMLNFKIDPYGRFRSGEVKPNEDIVNKDLTYEDWKDNRNSDGYAEPTKERATKEDYKPGATIYFKRVDYQNIAMGRKPENNYSSNAAMSFGDVKNVVEEKYMDGDEEKTGKFVFSDSSNWIVVTNKSSIPISVKLEATWTQRDGIELAESRADIEKSNRDDASPKIYMAVEMTEGYTQEISGVKGTKPVGQNYMKLKDGTLSDEGEEATVYYLTDKNVAGEKAIYVSEGCKWFNYIKTPNQLYKAKTEYVAEIPSMIKSDLMKQPYYLEQVEGKGEVVLQPNLEEYEKQDGYTYPTFGFRLTGAVNNTKKWEQIEKNPEIQLMWRLQVGGNDDIGTSDSKRPRFRENQEVYYQYNLDGVIDDRHSVTIEHGTGEYKTTKVKSVTWEMNNDGEEFELLNKGETRVPDHGEDATVVEMPYITAKDNADGTSIVEIRQLALLNWHDYGYLKLRGDSVVLKIYLEGYNEPLELTIVDKNADDEEEK